VVITKEGVLRAMEFDTHLKHSQIVVLGLIRNCLLIEGEVKMVEGNLVKMPQRQIHRILWYAFPKRPIF
jgi:hypothetical protein